MMTFNGMPKAVIFDWDHTLVDNWAVIVAAFNETAVEMGFPNAVLTVEESHKMTRSMRDTFPEIFGDQWQKARERFYQIIRDHHLDHLKVIEPALDLLKLLHSKNIHKFIISNKNGDLLRREIDHLGWGQYFEKITGAGDASHDKPHEAVITHTLQGWTLDPKSIWFVGDMDVDLECAKEGGMTSILIKSDLSAIKQKPDFQFDDLQGFYSQLL